MKFGTFEIGICPKLGVTESRVSIEHRAIEEGMPKAGTVHFGIIEGREKNIEELFRKKRHRARLWDHRDGTHPGLDDAHPRSYEPGNSHCWKLAAARSLGPSRTSACLVQTKRSHGLACTKSLASSRFAQTRDLSTMEDPRRPTPLPARERGTGARLYCTHLLLTRHETQPRRTHLRCRGRCARIPRRSGWGKLTGASMCCSREPETRSSSSSAEAGGRDSSSCSPAHCLPPADGLTPNVSR